MKEKSYEEITCNKGSFYSAKNGINLLLEYNIPFIVKGVILPQNRNETEEFETYASTIPWMSKPPAYSMFFDLRARRDKKNELIKKIRMTPEEGINILTRKKETYIKGIKQFCSIFSSPPGDKLFRCGAGAGKGSIDPYGNFQLCLLLREPSYNLKKGNLKECLTGFFPKIREVKAENPDYLRRCAKCFLKSLCEQCPAKSRSEHGTLDTPVEYFCDITHKQAEYLGLVKNGEKTWEVQNWKERVDNFS
jgi:radical SAM protein with 4Fe4S-binding SPASM domain